MASSSSDATVESIAVAVAKSGCMVKSQQRDEPELTESEKMTILREMISQRPATFLSRFGKYLAKEDLPFFDHLRDDYEVNFRLKELKTFFDSRKSKVNVRNRRYECLQRLMSNSDYFSEESMRKRCPLLYEQYIGQYLTEEEKLQRDKNEMGEEPSLSDFLLYRQEKDMTEWMYEYQKEKEEQGIEEDDDSSESESDTQGGNFIPLREGSRQKCQYSIRFSCSGFRSSLLACSDVSGEASLHSTL